MSSTISYQLNSMSDSNKSAGRLADGIHSCETAHISSSNFSVSKTSVVYEYDESMEIKKEIIDERHYGGEHILISGKSQLDENPISSGNKSAVKTEIVYEYDETLEIKEEIMQDPETVTGQNLTEKYESTLNTIDTKEVNILSAKKLRTRKKNKIRDPKPEQNYECQKCRRRYKHKYSLTVHQKFNCGVTPQFKCEFCDKRFTHKSSLICHVGRLHQKTNSNQNKEKVEESKQELENKHNIYRHQKTNSSTSQASYNCDKCFQSYSTLKTLKRHARLKHAAVKPQFICDFCGFKPNTKSSLSRHIHLRHFNNSNTLQAKPICDKCFRSYSSLAALKLHDRLKHAVDKPEFICGFCGYKTCLKYNLSKHISSQHFKTNTKSTLSNHISPRHFENSMTSRMKHNCNKCSQSYSSLNGIRYHYLAKHAAVKPQFICDICGCKTIMKHHLLSHIISHHLKNSEPSQERHNCDTCSRKYRSLGALKQHVRLEHAAVKPQFICDLCGYNTTKKHNLSSHVSFRHFRSSNSLQARHYCNKCSRNYSSFGALKRHNRLKHAADKLQFICDV